MSSNLTDIEDIRCLSLKRKFTIPVQGVESCILYEGFIVCALRTESHTELLVFDRITGAKLSTLQTTRAKDPIVLFRMLNWSVAFGDWDKKFDYASEMEGYRCHLHPFTIDAAGIVAKSASVFLLTCADEPDRIEVHDSMDDQSECNVAVSIWCNVYTHVYDISGVKAFPVCNDPNLTVENETVIFLVGRTIYVELTEDDDDGALKLYDLKTGNLLHTLDLNFLPFPTLLFRNRFILHITDYEHSLRTIDSTSIRAVNVCRYRPRLIPDFGSRRVMEDVIDDGCVMFIERGIRRRKKVLRIRTYRIDVPTLSDIAKEFIHATSADKTGTTESDDEAEEEEYDEIDEDEEENEDDEDEDEEEDEELDEEDEEDKRDEEEEEEDDERDEEKEAGPKISSAFLDGAPVTKRPRN